MTDERTNGSEKSDWFYRTGRADACRDRSAEHCRCAEAIILVEAEEFRRKIPSKFTAKKLARTVVAAKFRPFSAQQSYAFADVAEYSNEGIPPRRLASDADATASHT